MYMRLLDQIAQRVQSLFKIVSETIESLCKRAQEVCAHARHNLRHGQQEACNDDYAKKHADIYATTFGTRCHSCKEDKGITLVNIYPRSQSVDNRYNHTLGTFGAAEGGSKFCNDKKCYDNVKAGYKLFDGEAPRKRDWLSLPCWHIAEAASRAKEEKQKVHSFLLQNAV
ncbi:unnamed protein product [Strongylus vulgaris]|uniref:Uncharacterized protein n=1 Tax=Strongylus vulgaris TaxID=40348 RepID=A0A3P7IMJ0_STRVU|nr:unnamed protein product [Strongylus vulgaris]